MPRVLALIPARGGSKGIIGKNIAPLAGRPLLAYSIHAAQKSGVIDDIFVSSDDAVILDVAEKYGAIKLVRGKHLAEDHTPTNPVIEDFIARQNLKAEDIIVLLQPTSPLRTAQHIRESLAAFKSVACQALMSVTEIDRKYLYSFVIAENYLEPIASKYIDVPRRQELPALYLPNGALYIFSVEKFLNKKSIPKQEIFAYVMDKKYSLDIDTYDDLAIAESVLSATANKSDKYDD